VALPRTELCGSQTKPTPGSAAASRAMAHLKSGRAADRHDANLVSNGPYDVWQSVTAVEMRLSKDCACSTGMALLVLDG